MKKLGEHVPKRPEQGNETTKKLACFGPSRRALLIQVPYAQIMKLKTIAVGEVLRQHPDISDEADLD